MSHLAMLALALIAALLQVGVLPELEHDPLAAPLLPVALVAGWCAMRGPAEMWTVLLVAPLVAGPLSEERVGWFVLALIPAVALGAALSPSPHRPEPAGTGRRLCVAALVAAGGTAFHAGILALAARVAVDPLEAGAGIASAALWTLLLALVLALVLRPLRQKPKGLFA